MSQLGVTVAASKDCCHLKFDDHVLVLLLLNLGWTYQQIEQDTGIPQEIILRYDPHLRR